MSQESLCSQNANEKTSLLELSRYVEEKLKKFNNVIRIGSGASAIVYSTDYAGQMYALKSLNTNLSLGRKEIKKFIREKKNCNGDNNNQNSDNS
ncbi:5309_t:CDS:2, partial [Gigaspora rosea]